MQDYTDLGEALCNTLPIYALWLAKDILSPVLAFFQWIQHVVFILIQSIFFQPFGLIMQ